MAPTRHQTTIKPKIVTSTGRTHASSGPIVMICHTFACKGLYLNYHDMQYIDAIPGFKTHNVDERVFRFK